MYLKRTLKFNWLIVTWAFFAVLSISPSAKSALHLSCSFNTVSAPNFGIYDVYTTNANTARGSLVYSCVKTAAGNGSLPLVIYLSKGSYADTTYMNRRLRHTTLSLEYLPYNLYIDSAYSKVWSDNTGVNYYSISLTGPVSNTTVDVYGRIPPLADVNIGSYTDTVVVTMMY